MRYTPWSIAFSCHIQSLVFPLFEAIYQWRHMYSPSREIFEYKDGGIVGLDWICFKDLNGRHEGKVEESNKPIVILFPGLMGDHTKAYLISLISEGIRRGFDCVVPLPRGLGGVPLKTTKLFDGGNTDDYKEIVDYIHQKYCSGRQKRQIFAVGISMSAGVLSNYMSRDGENCRLTAAVGINCVFDTWRGTQYLTTNLFGIYDYVLGITARLTGRPVAEQLERFYEKECPEKKFLSDFNRVWTLSEDFAKIMIKCCDYKDKQSYYDELMVTSRLKGVKRPLFFLSSKDDQFFGADVLPYDQKHPNILLGVTKYGGHAMYFEGSLLPIRQWFRDPTFEFLAHFSQEP